MSIRLLIVDDSSAMRKMVERALRTADVELEQVFEAGNGKEALAILELNSVDLILCDINMPEMNGLEFSNPALSSIRFIARVYDSSPSLHIFYRPFRKIASALNMHLRVVQDWKNSDTKEINLPAQSESAPRSLRRDPLRTENRNTR